LAALHRYFASETAGGLRAK